MEVVAHTNAAGDVSVGVVIEDAFVPFVTFSAAKVAQHVQRGHILQERAAEGDERSRDVLGSAFKEAKAKGKGNAAKEGEG